MNRTQSIISAIISAACVFLVPYLNRKGVLIDESAVSTIVCGIIAAVAFIWTAWKNHNITEAAHEAQAILDELKAGEDFDDELDALEGEDDEDVLLGE